MLKLFSKQVESTSTNCQIRAKTMEYQKEERLMSTEFNLPLVTIMRSSNQVQAQSQMKKITDKPNFLVKLYNQQLIQENFDSSDFQQYTQKLRTQENSFDILKSIKLSYQMDEGKEKIKIRQLSLQTHKEKYTDFRMTQQSRNIKIRRFQEIESKNDHEHDEIDQFSVSFRQPDKQQNFQKIQSKQEKFHLIKQSKFIQSQLKRKPKIFIIRKLKRVFFCVLFAFVLLKQFKDSNKNQYSQLKIMMNQYQQLLKQYSSKNILYQRKQFVLFLAAKIVGQIQSSNYQKLCENLTNQFCVDFRKTNIINFSKQLYQNIELITRKQYFPKLFESEMIINLFSDLKRKSSYFVGKRCYFYSSTKTKIPTQQKQAISLEYLLFQVITPNLLSLVKDLELQTLNVRSEALNNLLSIVSLMQKQYIRKFENLPKLKIPNANMIYRRFNLLQLDDETISLEITENNQVGNQNLIIEGLIDFQILSKLEKEKPFWNIQMDQLFEKISENIKKIIDF